MIKRKLFMVCSALLALIIAGGTFASANASANEAAAYNAVKLDAPYEMTDEYKSGKYYKNLTKLSLSGDEARDVLAIAMSQVGYHEGNSDSEFSGESKTGTRDFVEYNVLYGKLDNKQGNGMSYGYYWCASFVNWCMRMAGVDKSASGSAVLCQDWYDFCKREGIFRPKSGYIPSMGDIIFFKDDGSSRDATHVGLVRYSDGQYVYTVEGNTSNGSEYSSNGEYVALKRHKISSNYISGYAVPEYAENRTDRRVDLSGGFLSLGEYLCESEIEIFTDAELKTSSNKKTTPFSVFSVIELSDSALKISCDGTEGYINAEAEFVQLTTSEDIYIVSYVDENGYPVYMPQYRRGREQKYIYANAPQRDGSGFVGWNMQASPKSLFEPGGKLPNYPDDMTFIAIFDDKSYTVTFKDPDGNALGEPITGYYGTQYSVVVPTAPAGKVFTGWTGGEPDGVVRGDASYTAVFVSEDELKPVLGDTDTEKNDTPSTGCASSISGIYLIFLTAALGVACVFKRKNEK